MNMRASIIFASILSLMVSQIALAQTTSGFEVTQKARNLTKQSFTWVDSLQADPSDKLEFQITINWKGANLTQNVLVREVLVEKLAYAHNLKLDGTLITGDITKENINIGTMTSGQQKMVTFEAQVAPTESFGAGTSNLVNVVTVFNANGGASTTSTVHITKHGVPTDVPTGSLSLWMIGLALAFAVALMGGFFLFVRSYLRREVFESAYDTRTDRRLATMIGSIKEKERKS